MVINKALNKYKHSDFRLEILEYCDTSAVLSREQYYINLLKPKYNILLIAGSSLGFKHSEKTLKNMRDRKHSEETRVKMSDIRRGKKLSEEILAKLRGR
jgi:group I intron endonuclease